MEDPHGNANVRKAVNFFTQAGLSRLLTKLRQKYIELGLVGGQVLLEDSTPDERREVASFLGKPPYRAINFKVRLVDIDKALRQSGFACTLPDVLSAFFPDQPLVTRREQRVAQAIHQADFSSALFSIATEQPKESRGRLWLLHGLHGQQWLFSRYKNAPAKEQERQLQLVRYIVKVLDQLPQPDHPERLALFAQRTSGNPHALDPEKAAGRLFLLALHDLASEEQDTLDKATSPRGRAQELDLYNDAGLHVDTISSNVAVFNLAGAICVGSTIDPLPQAAGNRVLLLPLRQLLAWETVLPASKNIYIFENPQVFETVISVLDTDTALPTLICTSGWPSAAAILLLDLLVAQSPDSSLHYSGDFDLKGLQIASHLMERYSGRCHPWRFDLDAYAHALSAGETLAHTNELNMLNALPDAFAPLAAMMQEKKQWAYQEGITHLLIADVRKFPKANGDEESL
ncbi:MAG TPA: TIGR02679 family protein [Ktedonobacteraceae bacterium]|nr:TIGR02679 family protein [Ktedonobacteraceae bacterium]